MKQFLFATAIATALAVTVPAQDPTPAAKPDTDKKAAAPADGWSEGYGRATNYRSALANALEDAVAKVKGIAVARDPAIRSRLSVVSGGKEGDKDNAFSGEADGEREWVQQQIAGFVLAYDVLKKEKAADGHWEVTVKAQIAAHDEGAGTLVVDLVDSDLRRWQLETADEDRPGAITKKSGDFAGPKIGDYLRRSGVVKIVAKGSGVRVGEGADVREKEKAGHQLVASHRVTINWQPITVQSLVEKTNKARPTSGPRPEFTTGGSVTVSVRVDNLVENVELVDETFTVTADPGSATPVDRLDTFVNALVDKAKALVAEKVFFTLRPPVVTRKWQEGDSWRVEAKMSKRIAAMYRSFQIGNNGSLSSPDWQSVGTAVLVDGNDTTCTLRLERIDDLDRLEAGLTEVRPLER